MMLLSMDYALLAFLVENGGSSVSIAIPAKIFSGDIPAGAPNLVELGVIEHHGDMVVITEIGRTALAESRRRAAA